MSLARQHLCLVALMALGLQHGLMQARVRPLYQVSDELQYIYGAQRAAVSPNLTPQDRCISPPDGSLLDAGSGGGKWAFQAVTSRQLSWACRDGGPFPLFLLRAFSALSLPLLVGSSWMLARSIWPGNVDVAVLAGLLVATHPVLVKYGSGVTPDAWANALAGVLFMAGARIVLGTGRFFHVVALVVGTALALTWKETATFLVVHLVLVGAIAAWRFGGRIPLAWRMLLAAMALATLATAGAIGPRLLSIFGTTYNVETGVRAALHNPLTFGLGVSADLLVQFSGMLITSWTVLGNFGGTPVAAVPSATAVAVITIVAAVIGWCMNLADPNNAERRLDGTLALLWTASAMLCLLQPSVRQVWAQSQDLHQGRWLFALAAPTSVLIAAGIVRLRPVPGWLALPGILWLCVMWITLGQLGQWYYARVPDLIRHAHVFTRGTGGSDVGDARVYALLDAVARQQGPAVFWFQGALFVIASLIMLWLLFSSRLRVQP